MIQISSVLKYSVF